MLFSSISNTWPALAALVTALVTLPVSIAIATRKNP